MHRPRVFLDVSSDGPIGRLTIELFTDKTPRTCENFRQLCTGEHESLSYAKTPFHRVIDEFMIQGGDIANGNGTGTASIYGGEFDDENLTWRELDAPGLVCAANRGRDTNGSQFFITLDACPHLNGKHTVFGRIVFGEDVLKTIAQVAVDANDRPKTPILVSRCGELENRKRTSEPGSHGKMEKISQGGERGRRRKSDDALDEAFRDLRNDKESGRRRRQSDNVVDEGLRGRPRQRSDSRSHSRAVSSSSLRSEASLERRQSLVQKHKRKRSASPSRAQHDLHGDEEEKDEWQRRRRRSLPNQYARDRHGERHRATTDYNRKTDHSNSQRHNYYSNQPSASFRYQPEPRDQRQSTSQWQDDRRRPFQGRQDYRDNNDHHHQHDRNSRDVRENEHGRLRHVADDGRLSRYGDNTRDDHMQSAVKFKGRGIMKYREPGRL